MCMDEDRFVTWTAWAGWMVLFVSIAGFFLLTGDSTPDCCVNATCVCYEEAE